MNQSLVLYDGGCPLCRACVAWAERRDRTGRLDFLPYDACPSPPMTPALRAACERSLHILDADGSVQAVAGRAVLDVLSELGWPVGGLRRRPFVWPVEAGYWIVARIRQLLSRWIHD